MQEKPNILIIQGDQYNRELFRDAFTAKGFDVAFRKNADGAFIDEVVTLQPSIIAVDIELSNEGSPAILDGFTAIQVLKGDKRTEKIPVVMMTSFFEEKKVLRAKEVGAIDFISIPGQSFPKIPDHFLRYLHDPKHYKSSHSVFRK